MEKAFDFTLMALAIAAISLTITRSHLTEKWREYLLDNRANDLFTSLMTCPYCMAHWVAFVPGCLFAANYYWTREATMSIVCWLALAAASTLVMGAMQKLMLSSEWEFEKMKRRLWAKGETDEH